MSTGPAAPILSGQPEKKPDGLDFLKKCREQEQTAENCMLKGISVDGESFYKISLQGVILEGCAFLNCDFEKSSFIDVVFCSCDFSNSRLPDSYFKRCEFRSVKGVGTDFHESLFREVCMEECVFSFANFSGTGWESALLCSGDFQDSYLEDCRLKKVQFQGLKLNRASFFHTSLRGMDLRENEIEALTLSEEKQELKGAIVDLYQAAELARLMGLVIR